MAGTVTRKQAEAFWNKYNKDGNDELTVDEVKACLAEVYASVDDFDVNEKFIFFGQKEAKTLSKDEFMKGIMRTEQCSCMEKTFKAMDKDGSGTLCLEELKAGLSQNGFKGEQADILLEELVYDDNKQYDVKEFLEMVAFSDSFTSTYQF